MRIQVELGDGWEDRKKGGGGKRGRQEEEEGEGEDDSVDIEQLKISAAKNRAQKAPEKGGKSGVVAIKSGGKKGGLSMSTSSFKAGLPLKDEMVFGGESAWD